MFRAALLCVVLLAMRPASAQSTSGSILGDVADLSGAFLPGATVTVSDSPTGAPREASTNEVGAFRVSGLPPANYSVTVEFPGFRAVARPSATLAAGGTTKVDFELDVGPIAESITVTGAVPLAQPTENTIQVVVANQRVQELPSKSRDFMDLMLLSPGGTVDQSSARSGNSDSASFYGMDERNKSLWLEGVDFNDEVTMGGSDISEATRTRLGQEAIQESQVLSSGYSAEFGRTGSGAINVVVKSGGNDIHGSGSYFIRDDDNFDFLRNDRPAGVGTWAGRGANFFRWDLRLTKKFVINAGMRADMMWEMYNVGNRANLVNFNGNQRATSANQARGAVPSGQFQDQLGLRFVFRRRDGPSPSNERGSILQFTRLRHFGF